MSSLLHPMYLPCTYSPLQAQQEVARSLELQRAVAEAEAGRVELDRRMQAAREELEVAQAQSAAREAELRH